MKKSAAILGLLAIICRVAFAQGHNADVNGSGGIDAVDVQLVVRAVLGMDIGDLDYADIDGSGLVDAPDVQLVVEAALGMVSGGGGDIPGQIAIAAEHVTADVGTALSVGFYLTGDYETLEPICIAFTLTYDDTAISMGDPVDIIPSAALENTGKAVEFNRLSSNSVSFLIWAGTNYSAIMTPLPPELFHIDIEILQAEMSGLSISNVSMSQQGGVRLVDAAGEDGSINDPTRPIAKIISPFAGELVGAQLIDIVGTAADSIDFNIYELSAGVGEAPMNWTAISGSNTEVVDGLLGQWDTTDLWPVGAHTIRLQVYDDAMQMTQDRVTVLNYPLDLYVSALEGSDELGNGSDSSPWATIGFAMGIVGDGATQEHPITIHVEEGTYDEPVVFAPNVSIVGAGQDLTTIQYYESFDPEHIVVTAAENTGIEHCTVTVPGYPGDNFTLIRIDDVAMTVENCILNGQLVPGSIGVFVSGWNSSMSAILNNNVERLEYGVYAVDTEANIGQNNYTSITGVGLFVSEPVGKSNGQALVPIFGSADTLGSAGLNCFRDFLGTWYIQNASQTPVKAQYNDWGAYDLEEISDKMAGLVEFEPFIGIESADTSGVIVAVLDMVTEQLVSASRQPTALLDELSLAGTVDPNTGLLVIQDVPSGTWTITAGASGYMSESTDIEVAENQTTAAILYVESYSGRADVNGIDYVNAVDVQLVINEALGIDTGFDCDIDDKDNVNAVDVQLVINAALGL